MRNLQGYWKYIVSILSIGLVIFQLYTAGFGVLPDIVQRSVHLGFVLTLCFILKPANKKAPKNYVPFYDIILAIISALSAIFLLLNYQKILWDPLKWLNYFDVFFAVVTVILVLEASRRCVGWIFPILAIFFLIYAYFGPYFPGMWGHQRFSFGLIFQTFYHSTNGIWGKMVGISATMLAMFGIFSSVLSATGGAQTFIKLGQILTGKSIGGQGKVALIASGLFGMISGSAMANVVATGTFTIPLMKKVRYSNEWAAAISAVGSTGGQIMPPIMGAGAFIMAQLLGISYLKIALAGIIPAILYYLGAYVAVHFISLKEGIRGESIKEKINFSDYIIIFVPIVIFIYFLARGYTVTTAAFYSTIGGFITSVLVFSISKKNFSILPSKSSKLFYDISISSSASILDMASLLAGSQITITLISMTGFGVKLSDLIVSIGQNNLFLCLILSMVVCIILGMGLPTTAAYVLAAAILAPALISLNLEPLIAHLFVFFFSTLATITPPVCAAVYLSSGIAQADWLKTGILSVLIALPAFIVPYTFVYNQSLLLMGSTTDVTIAVITALIGVIAIGIGIAGFIKNDLNMFYRTLLILSGVLMVIPEIIVSLIGIIVFAVVYILNTMFLKET
jgi:TRAP transporter 4TM/12TM fusion protein